MPITTHRIPAKGLTTFKCDGDLSFVEIAAVIERFFQGTIAPPTISALWDMRTASVDTLTVDHVYHIANLVSGYVVETEGTKTAVVVSKDFSFNMAKKFKEEAKDSLKGLRVFRKIEEAIEWLEKESE